jgi:hypothetical protein
MKKLLNENFMIEMSYKLYSNSIEGKPEETANSRMGKFKNNLFTENHLSYYYSNGIYQANIYKNDKVVLLNKATTNKKIKIEQFLMTDSNIWNSYSKIELIEDTLNKKTYKIYFQANSPIKTFEITFDKLKNLIIKNIVTYNPNYTSQLSSSKNKSEKIIVIEFLNMKSLTNEDMSLFFNQNIKIGKNGNVSLVNTLKTFKLYNYLNKR